MKDMLTEFVNFIRGRHTEYDIVGGCETCGYGGTEVETINVDALTRDLDKDIDAFIQYMKDRDSDV